MRTCIVTRSRQPESRLVRFVRDREGKVVVDLKRLLPGRGAWVLRSRDVLGRAIAQKAFSRAFRNESKADEGLASDVEAGLETEALVALCRAIQSGEVKIAGTYDGTGTVLGEIISGECAEEGDRSVARIISIVSDEVSNNIPAIIVLSAGEMNLAFGSSGVLKAFVLDGRFGRAFLNAAILLQDYRSPATNIVAKQTRLPNTRRGLPQDMD